MIKNWIKETTTTAGAGSVTLVAVLGFARFLEAFAADSPVNYVISNGNNWESGVGIIQAGSILARTAPQVTYVAGVYDDTSPAAITLAGTSTVFCDLNAAASSAQDGYLTKADWAAFNGKQAALGFTPINKAGDNMTGGLFIQPSAATQALILRHPASGSANLMELQFSEGTLLSRFDERGSLFLGYSGYGANLYCDGTFQLGADVVVGGDGYSTMAVKTTVSPGAAGVYVGLDFHMKTTGSVISVRPVGIRAVAEYTGSTSLVLSDLYGLTATARYSATGSPFYKSQNIGICGVAEQNSALSMLGSTLFYPGGNIAIGGQILSTAAGSGSLGGCNVFYAFAPYFAGSGLPSSYTVFNIQGDINGSVATITGAVKGIVIPNLTATLASLQVGIQVAGQSGSAVCVPIWINASGTGLASAIAFGASRQAGIFYDATGTVGLTFDSRLVDSRNFYFKNGNIGAGVTATSAKVHIAAGTAAAGTAPLKLTAGTNLTTAESGALEFDGTNLYFTVGGIRKTVTLA